MRSATKENTEIGEAVLVPIHGETLNLDVQIHIEYEVVIALRCKVKPEDQIVGSDQEAMPEYIEFNDQMAYKLPDGGIKGVAA